MPARVPISLNYTLLYTGVLKLLTAYTDETPSQRGTKYVNRRRSSKESVRCFKGSFLPQTSPFLPDIATLVDGLIAVGTSSAEVRRKITAVQ